MADRAAFEPTLVPAATTESKRHEQSRRRALRIAIRQTERAELYLVAIESLGLNDEDVDHAVEDLLRGLRLLRLHLVREREGRHAGRRDLPPRLATRLASG
jgi:hypothetical protein